MYVCIGLTRVTAPNQSVQSDDEQAASIYAGAQGAFKGCPAATN